MKNLMVILWILIFAGCDHKSADSYDDLSYETALNEAEIAPSMAVDRADMSYSKPQEPLEVMGQHIIRTANMHIQVEQVDSTLSRIRARLPDYKARIEHSRQSNHRKSVEHSLTIRVPGENLDNLLDYIESQASYLHEKEVNSRNVTEEFVDITSRLKNKKQAEKRYREILQEASTVEEILKVENQLRVIREEIEAVEGRLRYLSDQTALSTLHLSLHQPLYMVSEVPGQSYSSQVIEAFINGWQFFRKLVIGIVYLWPLWIVTAVAIVIIRKLVLKRQRAV